MLVLLIVLLLALEEFDYEHDHEQEQEVLVSQLSASNSQLLRVVPAEGIEPTHPCEYLDFESSASASSATPAFRAGQKLRRSLVPCN